VPDAGALAGQRQAHPLGPAHGKVHPPSEKLLRKQKTALARAGLRKNGFSQRTGAGAFTFCGLRPVLHDLPRLISTFTKHSTGQQKSLRDFTRIQM